MIQPAFEILNQRGTPMFFSDTFANIPTAGIVGRIFIRTDSPYGIYRDTGSTWDQIAGSGGGGGITGSGVAGQVTFWDGTSSVSGSNDLWFDNASGKFLVGTNNTTGAAKLQVTSATGDDQLRVWGATSPSIRIDNAVSGATQRFVMGLATATNNFIQGSAAGNICISTASANPLLFGMWQTTNASEVMRISTANNLLIGSTTDNGRKLQVTGTGYFTDTLTFERTINNTAPTLLNFINTGSGSGTGATFQFSYNSSLALTYGNGFTFTHNGSATTSKITNQGIFTSGSLNAATNLTFESSLPATIKSNGQATDSFTYIGGGSLLFQNFIGSYDTRLAVMRSTGNVIIQNGGTYTDAGYKLDVQGTGRFTGDILVNSLKIGKGNGSLSANTAVGELSLNAITNGNNTAVGYYAMRLPTNCVFNTAIGVQSLEEGTSYNQNTSVGYRSLQKLSTGNANTAIGTQSGQTITGGSNLTDSSSSIFIGYQAGALGNSQTNQIVIGNQVYGLGSNTTSIGNSSTTFAAIYGNLLLGSTTNQGQKLYVNGSVRIDGQTAATAGGSAGLHLILNLDGTNYKIALLNV